MADTVYHHSQESLYLSAKKSETYYWCHLDQEFRTLLSPITTRLNMNEITTTEAATYFSEVLSSFLRDRGVLKKTNRTQTEAHQPSRTRDVVIWTKRLAEMKNLARKDFNSNPTSFLNAVRVHNRMKQTSRTLERQHSTRKQEKAFRRNPWRFAQSAVTNYEPLVPSFSSEVCFNHFRTTFAGSGKFTYNTLPDWVQAHMHIDISEEFDMTPIRPSLVKSCLKKCSSSSSPGSDGISYFHMKKLPSTHLFLATLYTKILLHSHEAPTNWCSADIILLPKGGDPSKPENFRPIAKTTTVAKLFHKILARRLENYFTANDIIDTTIQKGFLTGSNGIMEHILALQTILDNARKHHRSLAMTLIDLKNAFGSVSHKLIFLMLDFIRMPTEICTYIKSTYSQLTASVSTRYWRTNTFLISQGIFQGDTLSPLIFLLAFNPIINLVKSLTSGYQIQIALPGRIPAKGKFIYLEWNEPQSSEPPGWYLCKIVDHTPNGLSEVQYNKDTFERVDLNTCTWRYAKGNGKKFLPPHCPLPEYTPKESDSPPYCLSHPHKAKSFADDLTILSSNPTEHQYALSELDQKCNDLGLSIRPDKCVSLALHEGSVTKKGFNIGVSQTTNLCDKPAKFLVAPLPSQVYKQRRKLAPTCYQRLPPLLVQSTRDPSVVSISCGYISNT